MFIVYNTIIVFVLYIAIRIYLKRDKSNVFWIVMPLNTITFVYLWFSHATYIVWNGGLSGYYWDRYFTYGAMVCLICLIVFSWEDYRFKKNFNRRETK